MTPTIARPILALILTLACLPLIAAEPAPAAADPDSEDDSPHASAWRYYFGREPGDQYEEPDATLGSLFIWNYGHLGVSSLRFLPDHDHLRLTFYRSRNDAGTIENLLYSLHLSTHDQLPERATITESLQLPEFANPRNARVRHIHTDRRVTFSHFDGEAGPVERLFRLLPDDAGVIDPNAAGLGAASDSIVGVYLEWRRDGEFGVAHVAQATRPERFAALLEAASPLLTFEQPVFERLVGADGAGD